MAAEETPDVSDATKPSDNEEYNPKLDFFSEEFDPLLALQTPSVVVPVLDAKTHDNIYKYKSAQEVRTQTKNDNKPATRFPPAHQPVERRWLPHQMPVKSTRTVVRKNLFTKMDAVEGPLQLLRVCKEKRLRIKISTRHSHDIRGYCLGFVVAFDKHWNLAVEEVEEVWTRPRRRKVPALDSAKQRIFRKMDLVPPPIEILTSTKKTETCKRHVDQLIIRGEQIALIAVCAKEEDT